MSHTTMKVSFVKQSAPDYSATGHKHEHKLLHQASIGRHKQLKL